MQLVLATNNQDKVREIRNLLDDLPVTILTRDDFLEFPDPEETGETLKDNALIKAREISAFCELPALADDSGLEVDALNGAPGVYSSRFAGPGCTYRDNNDKLLRELSATPEKDRTARFRCVLAIVWGSEDESLVEGTAEGVIAEDISGREGFGYDPVFIYPPANKRFSEMSLEEKNLVSHRGKALQKARDVIIDRLNSLK